MLRCWWEELIGLEVTFGRWSDGDSELFYEMHSKPRENLRGDDASE